MKLLIVLIFFCSSVFGQVQDIEIQSEGVDLDAYFYEASGNELKPTIIWMHGLPGQKVKGDLILAEELTKRDLNVLTFDYRGLWNNQGIFTVSNSQTDLNSVIDFAFNPDNVSKYSIDTTRIIVGIKFYFVCTGFLEFIY